MPRGLLIVIIVAACTLVVAGPAFASTTLNSYEKQLVTLINKARARRDLPQLRVHARLVDAARGHSAEMGELKFFAHASCDGETWSSRIERYGYTREGYDYWRVGENIYYGAGLWSSPVACFDSWMRSKAHRAVILTRAFRNIGVGAVRSETGYGSVDGPVWFFTLDVGRRIL